MYTTNGWTTFEASFSGDETEFWGRLVGNGEGWGRPRDSLRNTNVLRVSSPVTSNTLSENIPLLSIQTASLAPYMDPACLITVTPRGYINEFTTTPVSSWKDLSLPRPQKPPQSKRAAPHPLRFASVRGLRDVALCMDTACETYLDVLQGECGCWRWQYDSEGRLHH